MKKEQRITKEMLRHSILANWETYKSKNHYSSSETTYMLFDNLYRITKYRPELMKELYDTLIELNERDENKEMVSHLKTKKQEYFA